MRTGREQTHEETQDCNLSHELGPTVGLLDGGRPSGIPILTEMSWGTHLSVFYDTPDDLLSLMTAYFKAGLKCNEFCLWAISEPIDEITAKNALRSSIPNFDDLLLAGRIELFGGADWYLDGGEFDIERTIRGLNEKLKTALDKGFSGMRVSGNAFWAGTHHWKKFLQYEDEFEKCVEDLKMIALCTYWLPKSTIHDLLDVARTHQFTLTLRKGRWEILETPELKEAKREIRKLNSALDFLSNKNLQGAAELTSRERSVVAQLLRGHSSKEIARTLEITPRTVEFHRANVLKKTNTKSTVDLVRVVLGEREA